MKNVYITGPTNVAIENIVERTDNLCQAVCNKANVTKKADDKNRIRRFIIIRGVNAKDEIVAFKALLRNPTAGNEATPSEGESRWKLRNSVSYWLLMALRSRAVRQIHPDDSAELHGLQARLDERKDLADLRAVATGEMTWGAYEGGKSNIDDDTLKNIFQSVLNIADAVATTPAQSCQAPWLFWKENVKAFVVDEAGAMTRPDFLSVWGNTGSTVFLIGDSKQLSPAVMSLAEQESDGIFRNRHALDLRISALEWFEGTGLPVFRLQTQLRMADNLFKRSHELFYAEIELKYGVQGHSSNHPVGLAVEKFLQAKFPGQLRSPVEGKVIEAFIHCEETVCVVDERTGSRYNEGQVRITVELADAIVRTAGIKPSDISIIAPYKANVHLIDRKVKSFDTLRGISPAATVDSFHGRENKLILLCMGTTKAAGPGFTTDDHRLK
jgi:hypothetical protein